MYRLLLWVDRTTGLAHCYESDKCQPGRPWYERSLRFHQWLADELGCYPRAVRNEIDWLFHRAAADLSKHAMEIALKRQEVAERQRKKYGDLPEPGEDPELEDIIIATLRPYLLSSPPSDVLSLLTDKIYEYIRLEYKRKNLVGEGFEDVIAGIIRRIPAERPLTVLERPSLHEVPGFFEAPQGEKTKKVDLVLLSSKENRRSLVTAKWSIRADREEQFVSDYDMYTRLERAGKPFDYVLITNEFDPARLAAAATRQRHGRALFTSVVHVNPQGVLVAYGDRGASRSMVKVKRLVAESRIVGLSGWLERAIWDD